MGALNLETMNFVYKEFETSIKSENAVEFLKKLEAAYPGKGRIHLIWDQAGYHKGNDVLEYLKTSRIKVRLFAAQESKFECDRALMENYARICLQ